MAKIGLVTRTVAHASIAGKARINSDKTLARKQYFQALKLLASDVNEAIDQAAENPEEGIEVSEICTQFALKYMPDPTQDPGRATSLSQCQTLADMLAKVRKPDLYLKEIQGRFGPDLDPRQFPTGYDAFKSLIKGQTNRIYAESKGLNSSVEQNFCRRRIDLLLAVEKSYSLLRDQALGIESKPQQGKRLGK